MKISFGGLVITLHLLLMTIYLAAARSLPSVQPRIEDSITTRREASSDTISEATQFHTKLAELSIPGYLKDMYVNLTYPNGVARPSSSSEDIKVNTIQSYKNQAKNSACGHYKFDVRKDKIDGEEIIRAELRLLQKKSTTLGDHYNVDIYYLFNESSHQSPLQFTFKHIDSTPGWKTFDITPIVLSWKLGLVNHGLQLRLTKDEQMLSCEGIFSQGEEDPVNTEPLLIVFTNDHDSSFFKHMLKEDRKSLKSHDTIQAKERKRSTAQIQNVGCHRKEMVVTADSLSAGDMHVLLPNSFDIGVCEGHCTKLQLSPHTDHAHILSLYYRNNVALSEVPSRCCVPISYNKLNIIFYNETNGEHIIKQNVPAQANECDCL